MKDVSIGNVSRKRRRLSFQRGSSTLEILLAFAVLTLTFTAVIGVVFGNQSIAVDTQVNVEAIAMAAQNLEVIRASAQSDFYGLSNSSAAIMSGPLAFTESMTFTNVVPFIKEATSEVSWQNAGRTLSVLLTTLITDPDGYQSGDTCSSALLGDWTHPLGAPQESSSGYGYYEYPNSAETTGIEVAGGRAYLTTDPSAAAEDDAYIIDVRNPSPQGMELPLLGSYSTGYGLTDMRVSGGKAYAAAHSAAAQLVILSVSDPENISVMSELDVTQSGDTAYGNAVFYDYALRRAYLGTTKSEQSEFHIIDAADPEAPVARGGFEVGSAINQIIVTGDVAYLATASSSQQVIALDVSNPDSPVYLRSFAPPSSPLTGASVLLSGNTLYFGRIGGGNQAHNYPQLYSLDADTLAVNWSLTTAVSGQYNGVNRTVLRSNLLFVAAAAQNGGFEIWDVSNPAALPARYDEPPAADISQATRLDCEGNLLFIGDSGRALQIIGPS